MRDSQYMKQSDEHLLCEETSKLRKKVLERVQYDGKENLRKDAWVFHYVKVKLSAQMGVSSAKDFRLSITAQV